MGKAVLVYAFEEQVFGILFILYVMLFVGHDEVLHVLRDRMIFIDHLYLKRPERWMLLRDCSEHIPEIFIVRTYISHIVVEERAPTIVDEVSDCSPLLCGDPIQRLRI